MRFVVKVKVLTMLLLSCRCGQVPNYSPHDVIENLRRRIKGEQFVEMQPWYSGFAGSIEASLILWVFSRVGWPRWLIDAGCVI